MGGEIPTVQTMEGQAVLDLGRVDTLPAEVMWIMDAVLITIRKKEPVRWCLLWLVNWLCDGFAIA